MLVANFYRHHRRRATLLPGISWGKGQRGGVVVTLVYIFSSFFLAWLVVVVYRTWRQLRNTCGGTREGGRNGELAHLAVVVRDRDNRAEWLVRRRVAAAAGKEPGMRVVLVDGGSSDDTPLILERLARKYNMGFCRAGDLGEQCRCNSRFVEHNVGPGVETGVENAVETICPGTCFQAAGMEAGRLDPARRGLPLQCVEYGAGLSREVSLNKTGLQ